MNTSVILIGIVFVGAVLSYAVWLVLGPRLEQRNVRRSINGLWQLVESEQKLSLKVTEAGEVFEKALDLIGCQGEMDQKISSVSKRISNVSAVRSANALRMNLLTNTLSRPTDAEMLSAVDAYRTALIELGM